MARHSGTSFLAYVDLRYLPFDWERVEPSPILELLKEKLFNEALELVQGGSISIKGPLSGVGCSLLELAMSRSFSQQIVMADVVVLLDAMALQGETLDIADFEAACDIGQPVLVREFLRRGAPFSPDALHLLMDRAGVRSKECTLETAKCLLDAKASLNGLGLRGQTPLTTLCGGIGNRSLSVMEWLLKQGADPCDATGKRSSLHALLSGFNASAESIRLLVAHRADVNQKCTSSGNTPLHCALDTHMNYKHALQLKSLGADCSIANNQGVTPSQILLDKSCPELAAELEGRPMNEKELKVKAALEHPIAALFEKSIFRSIGWTLSRPPNRLCTTTDDDSAGAGTEVEQKLSDILNGCSPKIVQVSLPLTRYSELIEHVAFIAPEPEGFTVKSLLTEIYNYYQDPFECVQVERIQSFYRERKLGDTFGYISSNISFEEDESQRDQASKRRKVLRIALRGDSVYFEGFRTCKYFEDERKLCGSILFGS